MENEVMNEVEEKAVDVLGRGVAALIGVIAGIGGTLGVQKILKAKNEKLEDKEVVTEEK